MNKKEKAIRCKQILNEKGIISEDNKSFLLDVFKNHREWILKKGKGIINIYTDTAKHEKSYNQKCFYLVRNDGSVTDISYIKSIYPPSKKTDISNACRYAVREEIENYKKNQIIFGATRCAITNEILKYNNTHIDHFDMSFKDLVKIWLKDKNVDDIYLSINKNKDLESKKYFKDLNLNTSFLDFHNKNTNLRAVTKKANLTRKRI